MSSCGHNRFWGLTRKYVRCANCEELIERDILNKNVYPECISLDFIIDFKRAEVVCAHCGLVTDEIILNKDFGFNEFKFSQITEGLIIENPVTFTIHDKDLPTIIDNKNKDIYGQNIPSKNRAQWHRLRKLKIRPRVSGPYERNLAEALNKLDVYSSILDFQKP